MGYFIRRGGVVMVADKTFYELFSDYFRVYLPQFKKRSEHTIRSYRTALNSLLDFIAAEKRIKLAEITFKMIDAAMIAKYLTSLDEQGNRLTTRNLRLGCIKAFYSYAAEVNKEAIAFNEMISKIPKATVPQYRKVDYLSVKAVNALLEQPDIRTAKGRRDRFFILLMYDTGARLAEIRDMKLLDIIRGRKVECKLFGKGSKERMVPITDTVATELKTYLNEFHPNAEKYSDDYLFYVEQRGQRFQLSDSTARKIVREYGEAAKKVCAEITDIVHPHMLRHSRAMHLYQKGNDLALIQQWLGHVNMETTLVYAYADTEHKRKALEASIDPSSPLAKRRNAQRFTLSDDETVKKLYGLV
jgi:site-specific recombinase XerD